MTLEELQKIPFYCVSSLAMEDEHLLSYAYDATQDKHRKRKWFPTPREAFAALIDKVSGKGT